MWWVQAVVVLTLVTVIASETHICNSNHKCYWDVHNCGHDEILCTQNEVVYLDARKTLENKSEHCFAVNDDNMGEFDSYEINVDMMTVHSFEGANSGTIGVMFNYQDSMNYDFVYFE